MIMMNRSIPRDGDKPTFERGQLVRHRRYGYRGVVVDFDLECLADEHWYQSNQTQPDRSRPWYHVLVHDTESTTYAGQENLQEDMSGRPVEHPLIAHFFSGFVDGRHIRNDRSWPRRP